MNNLQEKEIRTVLHDNYAITEAALCELEGYDSTNYKVKSEKGTYVLKQYIYSEENRALLFSENKILHSLSNLDAQDFPVAMQTSDNALMVIGTEFIYRLLIYVEGKFLGDVAHTPALLKSLGIFLAKMDKTIHDQFQAAISAKETQWDLQHFKSNYKYLEYIPDLKDRSLVDYFFLQFDEQVYPIQHQLRKGIIHNDANDWNVLTQNGKVSGIIDFGDMCHSWIINEVGVAITYVMMEKEDPLQIASELIKGYCKIFPLEEIELQVLYFLVAGRLCTSVCNSAYTKTLKPDSEYITISERPAWKLLRKWLVINPVKAEDAFRKAAGFDATKKSMLDAQLKKRKDFVSEALSLSYKRPIQMRSAAFQYMYDEGGNTFLDAYNNIMLAGHCHPKVVRAGQRAMAKLNTNTRYVYEELQDYSEKLLSKFPPNLNKVFFVNSGSAATDLGLRMAVQHSHKDKIMGLEHGYHGNTRMAVDVSHYKYANARGGGQKNYVLKTPMPKAFGSGYDDDGAAGRYFGAMACETIDENLNQIAAFIAEPNLGCGGQVPLATGYLKEIYPKLRAQGGICISDEVQVGFGRLGDFFWGFEMHGVEPDMVIIGKPMGNGHPIGAVVTSTEIAASFEKGPEFFSSFGGNPVSCAIGHAVLEVIEEEGLQENARRVGNYFMKKLLDLQPDYPFMADVRGSGLFIGVEIITEKGEPATKLASDLKNYLREHHILIGTDGPFDNVLKIKPPLSFSKEDVDKVIMVVKEFLGKTIQRP
jgi:4-aminobutyrate aminotransferase-like enzyme/Ser/Thr protein kinase RdoA (MazF antagonist)